MSHKPAQMSVTFQPDAHFSVCEIEKVQHAIAFISERVRHVSVLRRAGPHGVTIDSSKGSAIIWIGSEGSVPT